MFFINDDDIAHYWKVKHMLWNEPHKQVWLIES